MCKDELEILELGGVRWATVAETAHFVGKPEITLYKARDAGRLPWRLLAGRIVVDIDVALVLYPAPEREPADV